MSHGKVQTPMVVRLMVLNLCRCLHLLLRGVQASLAKPTLKSSRGGFTQ